MTEADEGPLLGGVRLLDAMLLVDTADDMYWAIRDALAGHDWFDCWDSINEAAAVAVRAMLVAGPPIMDAEWREAGREISQQFDGAQEET